MFEVTDIERPETPEEFIAKLNKFSLEALVELYLRYSRGDRNFSIELRLDRSIAGRGNSLGYF